MRDRDESRSFLIRAALSPASLELKLALRRFAAGGDEVLVTGRVGRAGAAWLYWLFDGIDVGAAAGSRFVSRRFQRVSGLIERGGPVPFQGRISAPGRDSLSALLEPSGALSIAVERPDAPLSLVFPEGDGLRYAELEARESGVSRLLPDRVIDEALDFADSWS